MACHSELLRFVSGSYSKIHDSSLVITFYWKSGLSWTQSRSTWHVHLFIHWLTPSAPNATRKHLIHPWHHSHKHFWPFYGFHSRFYRVCSNILLRNAARVNGGLFTNRPTLRKGSEALLGKIFHHPTRMKRYFFVTLSGR